MVTVHDFENYGLGQMFPTSAHPSPTQALVQCFPLTQALTMLAANSTSILS